MQPSVHSLSGPSAPGRRLLFIAIAALLGVLLSCVAAEVLLRLAGRQPWRRLSGKENEPTMHEPDPRLGWKPMPGEHVIAPYFPGGPTIHLTFLPDGTRRTGDATTRPANGQPHDKVAFVGGSTTQGWAIDDDETFAWRLQQQFGALDMVNYGVTAYGTYQTLLLMEQVFAAPDPPRMVFYGFDEEHEARNVGDLKWLLPLALIEKGNIISTPYCTLGDNGALIRHAPATYPRFPLREYSALITFLQERYANATGGYRSGQARAVTEQLLIEMQRLAAEHGSRFCVVLLHWSPESKTHYVEFLSQHNIDFVDCAFPLTGDTRVHGDHHANGPMNARYAECIAPKLRAAGHTDGGG